MNGVTSASDSAGSNQRGAIVIPWTRVICPAGPSARAAENASDGVDAATRVTSTRRNRGGVIRQSPDELLREVLGLHDFGEKIFRVDLLELESRGNDRLGLAGLDADKAAVGLELL